MDLTRRRLFGGRLSPAPLAFFPPWAGDAASFVDACTRCGDCVRACPVQLLTPGAGGFPIAQFERSSCTLCGHCVEACRPRALSREGGRAAFGHVAHVAGSCLAVQGVECRVCGEACDARAIGFRPQLGGVARPQIDDALCNGCGACVATCPSGAIALEPPETALRNGD